MMSRPVVVSPVKAILAMRREEASGLQAEAVHHVEDAGRQEVAHQLQEHQDGGRRLLGGLQHDAVARRQRRRELPDRHEDGEVPGDDLPDHAERLEVVVGDGGVVDLVDRSRLRSDDAGEVAEVVDGERHVGGHRLAHRLSVVPGLGHRQQLEVLLHAVGDLVEDDGPGRVGGLAPGHLGGVGGVEGEVDVGLVGSGDLAERLSRHRRDVLKVLPLHRCDPLPADVVLVALLEGDLAARLSGLCVDHGRLRFDASRRGACGVKSADKQGMRPCL
jgi:hypothetical protein